MKPQFGPNYLREFATVEQGDITRVDITAEGVQAFADQWPEDFGPIRPMYFEFNKAGDLADLGGVKVLGDNLHDTNAINALKTDCARLAGWVIADNDNDEPEDTFVGHYEDAD